MPETRVNSNYKSEKNGIENVAADDKPSNSDNNEPCVMIIDDEIMNLEVMHALLSSKSINSDQAMGGHQALNLI